MPSTVPGLDGIDLCDLDRFADGFPHDTFRLLRTEAPVWWHPPTPHTRTQAEMATPIDFSPFHCSLPGRSLGTGRCV